jgi:4-carboxymuconolactone decarboxylase
MGRERAKNELPSAYEDFIERFPTLEQAWNLMRKAEAESGPLDERTRRLLKLAIAIGSEAEGATHSAVRKALAVGVTRQELEQVAALAASTMGLPNAVKVYRWVQDVVD